MGVPFHEVRQWSAAEVMLYQCYYRIAPWGEDRADIRNALSMSQTANMHRDSSKYPQPFPYTDFMPFHKKEKTEPDMGAMKGAFAAMARRK